MDYSDIPYEKRKHANMGDLVGLVFQSVVQNEEQDTLTFTTTDNRKFVMCHFQDCCESVVIESITGDLNDLIGEPILLSEEVDSEGAPPQDPNDDSFTWTFYKMATRKGYVDIRWYGSSNGYYGVGVNFAKVN